MPTLESFLIAVISLLINIVVLLQIVIWDALTAERVARWPSNHNGSPRWIEHSPVEAAFVSCGNDRSVRYWKGTS